jgi:hypothetical protein
LNGVLDGESFGHPAARLEWSKARRLSLRGPLEAASIIIDLASPEVITTPEVRGMAVSGSRRRMVKFPLRWRLVVLAQHVETWTQVLETNVPHADKAVG